MNERYAFVSRRFRVGLIYLSHENLETMVYLKQTCSGCRYLLFPVLFEANQQLRTLATFRPSDHEWPPRVNVKELLEIFETIFT